MKVKAGWGKIGEIIDKFAFGSREVENEFQHPQYLLDVST